ncbi:potassium channel protein [Hujiaoplasma nucleasis]|uniref:Potassium channel protein n=1 Tax=Hujiaoplasma nucleasis TaxID=2725268 RepID=A0A7L6N815_9MOLU|nr:potassium channel protein [Hujiaoplasma nucleasis]QLY40684.1 potassium channel protein [Hujiaoplasma nucleasis]
MNIKKISIWLGVMLGILILGSIGYLIILDITFIDALYMTIITMSTVGFNEVSEMNTIAKMYTIIIILLSVGMIGYILKIVFDFFSQGDIRAVWRRNKMDKTIESLSNHYIICGAGDTGINVITQFIRREVPFVVVEKSEEAVKELDELNVLHILGDASKEEVLQKAGVERAKGLITTLSSDAENVFIVITARQLNHDIFIISRFHDRPTRSKLIHAGANRVVSPDEIGGKKMAQLMISPNVQFFVDNIIDAKNMSINMEEVVVHQDSELAGKSLRQADVSNKIGLIILGIRREEDKIIFNPKANEILRVGDRMIVVGSKEQITKISDIALDNK